MLAYVDALCAALLARNSGEIRRLLGLPMAIRLPRGVREEATALAKAGPGSFMAPVQALHYYYTLTHLVDETSDPLFAGENEPSRNRQQMELPLRAAGGF